MEPESVKLPILPRISATVGNGGGVQAGRGLGYSCMSTVEGSLLATWSGSAVSNRMTVWFLGGIVKFSVPGRWCAVVIELEIAWARGRKDGMNGARKGEVASGRFARDGTSRPPSHATSIDITTFEYVCTTLGEF